MVRKPDISIDSHVETLPPSIVRSPERFEQVTPLGDRRFARFHNFLLPEVAEVIYRELRDGLLYERVDIAGMTLQWRAQRELGDAYFGSLQMREGWQTSEVVQECYDLFAHPWFENLLSRLMGCPIIFLRPATPYRMEQGDRICFHDDLSDPSHRLSVILGFTKHWRREYGGNTVIGEVTHIEDVPTPPDIPFPLRRWHVNRARSVITPTFNSLTIIPISPNLAHAVTPIRVQKTRFTVVSIYGTPL